MLGVTFFSIMMNGFIEIVLSIISHNFNNKDDALDSWFAIVKRIKN